MLERLAAADLISRLSEETGRGRPPLHISVTPPRTPDAEHVNDYGETGVDRLIIVPPLGAPLTEVECFVEDHAPGKVGARVAS